MRLHHPKTSKLWYSKTGPTDRQTTDRCDVDDHIINFDNILNSVLNCQFITNIPPAFTMAEKKQDRPGTGDTTSLTGGDRAGKRRKTSEDEKSSLVRQDAPNDAYTM